MSTRDERTTGFAPGRPGTTSRRRFLSDTASALGALAAAGVGMRLGAQGGPRPPNLLIVMPDQMRGMAMGFLGEEPVLTPTLDRFATESLVLPQAVSTYPLCSPMRGMLMTGQYPHANGVLENCNSTSAPFGYELKTSARTWSDVLKSRGYSLGYIGKWHLDSPHKPYVDTSNNTEQEAWNEWTPPERRHGFDFWYAYGTYDQHLHPEYWTTNATRDQRTKVNQWGPEHEADMAIRYLRNEGGAFRRTGQPFALVVAMNPPHMPYGQLPARYVERYAGKTPRDLVTRANVDLDGTTAMDQLARNQIKNYFAAITGVDEQFGRILAALDELGLRDDTIVLFTSDHGNCLGAHQQVSKNVAWEESVRVPFLIRWPGRIAPRHDPLLIATPDIAPTLLHLMGLGAYVPAVVQGANHAPLFLTGQGPRPASQLYINVAVGQPAYGRRGVRTDRYTLVVSRPPAAAGRPPGPQRIELYDRIADPAQLTNVADRQSEVVRRLLSDDLAPWLRRTGDPWQA
jgi:arylsulfatase A-like enzyme